MVVKFLKYGIRKYTSCPAHYQGIRVYKRFALSVNTQAGQIARRIVC